MEVVLNVLLTSKTMFKDNNEWYVRLEFSQEKGLPPMVASPGDLNLQNLMPFFQQIMRTIIPQSAMLPRLILVLREEEWEKLENKPDIGDEIVIRFSDNKEISFKKN